MTIWLTLSPGRESTEIQGARARGAWDASWQAPL